MYRVAAFCLLPITALAQAPVTAADFAAKALPALPIEEPYDFLKPLYAGGERLRRDPAARASAREMSIPAQGWSLVISSSTGAVLKQAAETFRDYLATGMGTHVNI